MNNLKFHWKKIALGQVALMLFILAFPALSQAQKEKELHYVKLKGNNVFPEGISYDTKTGTFYVGSFRRGDVEKVKGNDISAFIQQGENDLHSVVGIRVDTANRRLWVCNSEAGASTHVYKGSVGRASIQIYNLGNHKIIGDFMLTGKGSHFCNDIALDSKGNAYITDSFSPIIWKVPENLSGIKQWVKYSKFEGKGFNLNGIVVTPGQKYVICSGQIFPDTELRFFSATTGDKPPLC